MVKIENREVFLGLFIAILLADISILLNLPFFRQFFGFLFVFFVPGIIILRALKLNNLGTSKTFVFTIGLSVTFNLGIGLLINTILPFLGYNSPLSTISILIFFNIIEIILLVLGYRRNSYEGFTINVPLFNKIDKICLIIAFFILFLSMIGIYIMNQLDENFILISLFFVIVFLISFMALKNNTLSSSLYPLLIFIISISLILIFPLRSTHVMGVDTQVEYYFFQYTLNNLHWAILENGLFDACLSISLLPSVYISLLGITPEYLFKTYSPLLFSISPVVVYLIAKKYIDSYYAFLASVFFMSQSGFISTAAFARTNIAILFIGLFILSLFSENIDKFNKNFLIISFLVGCVLSHYSSSYIFFLLLTFTYIITYLVSIKYKINRNLSFFVVVIFFFTLFFWFSLVIVGPFTTGVHFIERIFVFNEARWAPELSQLSGQNLSIPLISPINLAIKWLTFFFIGYGLFIGAISWLKNKQKIPKNQIELLPMNLDIEFIIIGCISGLMLITTVILPHISVGYEIERIFLLLKVVLSIFFIIGGIFFIKQLNFLLIKILKKEKLMILKILSPIGIVTLLVILNFLFTISIPHQFAGHKSSIFFNSNGNEYNESYIHDQDSFGAKWIKNFREENSNIYSDVYGEKVLQSQGDIRYSKRIPLVNAGPLFGRGYLFTIYYNNINGKIINKFGDSTNLAPRYEVMIKDFNKIYSNDASEIWNIQSW